MPLEELPDLFDDATHEKLDDAVNEAMDGDEDPIDAKVLLNVIVGRGDGLDRKYLDMAEAKKLIKAHGELGDMLTSAWRRKSYREVRNLAILRAPRSNVRMPASKSPYTTEPDLHRSLAGSFRAEYHGAGVDGFYEYLTRNEKLFRAMENNPPHYAKICSVVQSSGTGKSRMLTELSKKDVVVIYMNLREETDTLGFPTRDLIPSQILTKFPPAEQDYRVICYAFFIALFDALEDQFSNYHTKKDVMHWVCQMCDMSQQPRSTARVDFFHKVSEIYTRARADLVRALDTQPSQTTNASTLSDVDETATTIDRDADKIADRLKNLSLSAEQDALPSNYLDFGSRLFIAYMRMARRLNEFFPNHAHKPKLVIAIDEAHPLTRRVNDAYRPADIFCRVINRYSYHDDRKHAVWVVFASTTSKVADFSPPNHIHNSNRIALWGEKLFPPYTQLGWDQSAWKVGEVDIEQVARVDHIAGYGRPLWISLKTALGMPMRVLDAALFKLCGGYYFDPSKTTHVLAVLGQRFGLNVTFGHPNSVEHLENGVASHLRICLGTTLDRSWRFTSYPSEPLLASVAASALHDGEGSGKLNTALGTLLRAVNSGMIDVGQRGELASRLLWLLAKDLFLRKQEEAVMPSKWDDPLVDCQMISVVEWLEFIFGPRIWDGEAMQRSSAREAFQNAYLNFSHWVCMETNIAGSKEGNELSLIEWTRRHWERTSAVQCSHQQPLIDKVIPMYIKGGSGRASAVSGMSQIFISDKARKSESSKADLHSITRQHRHISGEDTSMRSASDSDSLPYIAILADLGQPSALSVTFPEREVRDRCLRIYAAGVETTTYAFLANHPKLAKTLEDLVHLQQIPETETFYMEYLNAQVKFGSTARPDHMLWENSRIVPNLQGKHSES